MAKWEKVGKTTSTIGTTILYRLPDTPYWIESRKRHIPHANGVGTWDHTTYALVKDGMEIVVKNSLRDAKEYAERLANGEDKSNH